MTEKDTIGGASNCDREQDADGGKEASSHVDGAGGMGKGGATHNDFGKDNGIRPDGDEAPDPRN